MRALDERSGELIWDLDTKSEGIYSSPALVDGILYFGNDGLDGSRLYAVDTRTGEARWKFAVPTQIFSTPAVEGGMVYFHARDDHVYALSAENGQVVWKTPAPHPQQEFAVMSDMSKSSTAIGKDKLFVGIGRELVAMDRATGKVLWRTAVRGKVDSSPLIVGNTVYAGADDRRFYAFDINDGKKTWEYATGGKVSASPSAGGGLLLIGSNDGFLYAFGAAR